MKWAVRLLTSKDKLTDILVFMNQTDACLEALIIDLRYFENSNSSDVQRRAQDSDQKCHEIQLRQKQQKQHIGS